ncbi:hypothetical protein B6U91_02360 [Candidatus Pacearchaeota archaeon ex4484_71]|nr:MAG: hypothetical protein B6U91_02360 [Candidatus Pacearchaeota archaeon ex4484_71]
MFLNEQELYAQIENETIKGKEFSFLEKVSYYYHRSPPSIEAINFCLDAYLDFRKGGFDKFSSKRIALRKAFDFIAYEETIFQEQFINNNL